MSAGERASDRTEAAGQQHPVQHQVGTDIESAAPEAPGEAAEHERGEHDREPRNRGFFLDGFELLANHGRCGVVIAKVLRHALQVACADHRQHFAGTAFCGRRFAQACGHVAIALGDDRVVQRRAVAGEFAEARFEHVALLEFLDLVAADFLVAEQRCDQSAAKLGAPPPAESRRRTLEGDADVAVDQVQREVAFARIERRGLQFGAGFDPQLFGEPALVRGEAEVGGEQRGLAFAQHLDQVELGQRIGIGQRRKPLRIQFDGDGVVTPAGDRSTHRVQARLRDMGGTEQRVAHAVAFDDGVRLVGERVVRGGTGGFGGHSRRSVAAGRRASAQRSRSIVARRHRQQSCRSGKSVRQVG